MRILNTISPVVAALFLAGCAAEGMNPDAAAEAAPQAQMSGQGYGTSLTVAGAVKVDPATASALMADLMADAAQIAAPAPDMIAYARCVGLSDYMTAHALPQDRKDWRKDTAKFEALAANLTDYDAGAFASERETIVSRMAEALRAVKMDPDAAVTK
jgi:hypothetical protein